VAVLLVEFAAVALVACTVALLAPPRASDVVLAVVVAGLGVIHTELATGIERIRRRSSDTSYFDLSSVWTFAGALLLPPVLAAGVVVAVYAHLWLRVWRPARVPLYRHVYTTATVVLAATSAHVVVRWAGGLPSDAADLVGVLGVAGAVLAYVVTNTALVAGAIWLSRACSAHAHRPALPSAPVPRNGISLPRDLFGRWDDNVLEVATLCMGALAAVALGAAPGLIALALPPVLVLHRAVLVRQLEEVAYTDGKTGLLTAAAWQAQAAQALRRAQRTGTGTAVMILDLDHFKAVNDRHGHLAGDDVLAAVGAELQAGVRAGDLVGRFGGEEFVVLMAGLPSAERDDLPDVAERLRLRIAALRVPVDTADGGLTISGLSVSIGGARVPTGTGGLEQVLKAADTALYAAKRGGRNLVRIAGPVEIPSQRGGVDSEIRVAR
jgi:diguanylate cyclase (GGDEF)-like protein